MVTIYYEFAVSDGKIGTWYGKPFISQNSADDYAIRLMRRRNLRVRVKPGDPETSLVLE